MGKCIQMVRDAAKTVAAAVKAKVVRLKPSREPHVRKWLQVAFACSLVLFILWPFEPHPLDAKEERQAALNNVKVSQNPNVKVSQNPTSAAAEGQRQATVPDRAANNNLNMHARQCEERAGIVLAIVALGRLGWATLLWCSGYRVRFTPHVILLGVGGGLVGIGLALPLTVAIPFGVYLLVIGHTWEAVKQTSEIVPSGANPPVILASRGTVNGTSSVDGHG